MKKHIHIFLVALLMAPFFVPGLAQATGNAQTCEVPADAVTPVVSVSSTDSGVLVSWEKISHTRFEGYKVVVSENNSSPKYSEDGYLKYLTDANDTSLLVNNSQAYNSGDFGYYLEYGHSYYFSVTALYNCGHKLAGNAVLATYEGPTHEAKQEQEKEQAQEQEQEQTKDKSGYDLEIDAIKEKAKLLSENKLDAILAELKELRNLVKEQQAEILYLKGLTNKLQNVAETMRNAIQNFVAYGVDDNTQNLGEGERAAVMYSYEKAFGKLPETESDLEDAIKIANGRWPGQRSLAAEQQALAQFQRIYQRLPDYSNVNDEAAITIMSYGLRQKAENRKLVSEQRGIEIFEDIYGYVPESTEDWNIMQAITYSGAHR